MNPSPAATLTVLVSVRIDPVSGRATRSRADAAGVALAQQALGGLGEPRLCTAGAMPESVARDYLALGVSQLTRLPLPAQARLADVATALALACQDSPLVLAGPQGEAGMASGLLPYALAQRLQRPLVQEVIDLQRESDGSWRVVQALPRGGRHAWLLAPGRPAVLVSSARLAQREDLPQRHAWVAAQAGTLSTATATAATSPSSAPPLPPVAQGGRGLDQVQWASEPARRQRRPLAAVSTESGAARMARATGSAESARQGGLVIREGTPGEKAQRLLDHLKQLALLRPAGPGSTPG